MRGVVIRDSFRQKTGPKPSKKASSVYALIAAENLVGNQHLVKGTPAYFLQQWLDHDSADSTPEDFAVWCWNQRNLKLEDMRRYLSATASRVHKRALELHGLSALAKDIYEDTYVADALRDAVYLLAIPDKDEDLAKHLKAISHKVLTENKDLEYKFAKKLNKFFTPDKSLAGSFLDFIKADPKMAVDYFKILQEKVQDPNFTCNNLSIFDLRSAKKYFIDPLKDMASAQLRYRTKVNNNLIKSIFGSALVGLALCVSIAFHPVASTLLLAAAVASGVYYYRSKDQDTTVTTPDNTAEKEVIGISIPGPLSV